MDMMDIGHGFFMIKFDLEVDREKVINEGPWMIFDHCVAIRPWTTDFISSQVKINKTLVWIRFPSLGMEYYDESLLLALATAVGTPVKVDVRTLEASRGKFARVCIEIDLDKPVVGKVWFRDYWYHIEYEGLHLLCKNCGIYGHVARKCPSSSVGTGTHKKETGDVNLADGSTATASSQPQPNLNTSMTSINGGVESAEESLYGDWLVVNRKKNQGRKTRAKLQEEKEVNQNKSSKNVKGGMFAQLADAGEIEFSGTPLHSMGTKFHPGESSNIPKV
jgi:hypothetical protein